MPAHETTPIPVQRPLSTFSWSGVAIGALIGTVYCITNIYFGLKTGHITGAPIATAFFTILISKSLNLGLRPGEIMFAITISTAIAIMSLAGGFVGPIPALTQLVEPKDDADAALKFSWLQLVVFAGALSGFGPIFALLMRGQFLGLSQRYGLPFPSASATAQIILEYADTDSESIVDSMVAPDDQSGGSDPPGDVNVDPGPLDSGEDARDWIAGVGIAASLIYAALTFSVPSGPAAPVLFRIPALYPDWVDVSPGLIGQGIIVGPHIAYETFLGAVFAKLVLPWVLHLNSWLLADEEAEREADDARIWALWLGLIAMLADSLFKILWTLGRAVRSWWQNREILPNLRNGESMEPIRRAEAISSTGLDATAVNGEATSGAAQSNYPPSSFSKPVLGLVLVALAPLCVFALQQSVGKFLPWPEALITISLALPLCYVSILATGRTDYTPANALGRFSQIIVAYFGSSSVRYDMIVNIAMGAVVESAACQAATMMSKLKAGAAVGADPDTLFWGQLSGSLFGALVASVVFQYLVNRKTANSKPASKFNMPGAHMFLMTARVALNAGLPKHSYWAATFLGSVFWIVAALKECWSDKSWVRWIPSGTSFATGMYNVPAVTIDWGIGSLIGYYWGKRGDGTVAILFGSGLMVGEGLGHLILGSFA